MATKKQAVPVSPADDLVAQDFIFAYKCSVVGGAGACIYLLKQDGTLGSERIYKWDTYMRRWHPGFRYRGASFSTGSGQSRGLPEAMYVGRWKDQDGTVMDWEARHEKFVVRERAAKGEKADKISEIDELMLPLRKRFAAYRRVYDYASQEMLEAAVLRSLRRDPRATEEE